MLDNEIINRNNETIKKILNNETQTPIFINPNKIIKQNNYVIQFNYDENGDNFEKIKKENIELFKIQKQKNKTDLTYLLKNKSLGQEPWLKLTSLMKLTNQNSSGKHIKKQKLTKSQMVSNNCTTTNQIKKSNYNQPTSRHYGTKHELYIIL